MPYESVSLRTPPLQDICNSQKRHIFMTGVLTSSVAELRHDKVFFTCPRSNCGSFVRGEQKKRSAIDILVEFDEENIPGVIKLSERE
jgi:hypothetical protein